MGLNPLEQLNIVTIVGMIVVFWLTFAALKVVFYNPLLDVMLARREKVEAGRATIRESEGIVAEGRRGADEIAAAAEEEAVRIGKETADEVERRREERLAKAKAEAEKFLADGRTDLIRLRKQEEDKVRDELVDCTEIAVGKLVGDVDRKLVGSIVDKVMRARLAVQGR